MHSRSLSMRVEHASTAIRLRGMTRQPVSMRSCRLLRHADTRRCTAARGRDMPSSVDACWSTVDARPTRVDARVHWCKTRQLVSMHSCCRSIHANICRCTIVGEQDTATIGNARLSAVDGVWPLIDSRVFVGGTRQLVVMHACRKSIDACLP